MDGTDLKTETRKSRSFLKTQIKAFLVLFVFWLGYSFMTFSTPIKEEENVYELSNSALQLIRLSIVLPILLIWGAALSGAVGVKVYAKSITDDRERKAWTRISNGIFAFLVALVSTSLIQTYVAYSEAVSDKVQVIASNYIQTFLYLLGYILLYQGSVRLLKAVTITDRLDKYFVRIMVLGTILTVTYVYAVFQNETRTVSEVANVVPTYFLDDPMIFATIVLPTAVGWIMGIAAAANLMIFRRNVKGILYKKALKKLYVGLSLLILFAVLLQLLVQSSSLFFELSIAQILALIYVIFLFWSVAYIYVAIGSRNLLRIEEL